MDQPLEMPMGDNTFTVEDVNYAIVGEGDEKSSQGMVNLQGNADFLGLFIKFT